MSAPLFIGIDLGTSGVRAIAIDQTGSRQGWARCDLPPPLREGRNCEQDPELWWQGVRDVLGQLCQQIDPARVRSIAVDGTSSTLLLADADGTPLAPALMYNDTRSLTQAERIATIAPRESAAHGPGSSLSKLLYLIENTATAPAHALHQADWILQRLGADMAVSDENNALKLGYDPLQRQWPGWIADLAIDMNLLPEIHPPGTPVGNIAPAIGEEFGLNCELVTGTTDSTAAFIASGASRAGEAVTSLGSTMVMKVLSEQPIYAPEYGVYSHRLDDLWLVGGASNSGGAVLTQNFCPGELQALTAGVNPDQPTGLDYYPLPAPGERFPVSDPELQPRMTPRPEDDRVYFQAILEGMTRIETRAYRLLAELGAPWPVSIRSAGGGAHNKPWTRMRQAMLQVPLIAPDQLEAAYGSALLARKPFQ